MAVVGVVLVVTSCRVGPSPGNHQALRSAAGVRADIVLLGTGEPVEVNGELLAVQDRSFLVHTDDSTIVRVAAKAIRTARINRSKLDLGQYHELTVEQWTSLRLLARYPQGVSEDLLQLYLDSSNQQSVIEYQ